MSVAKHVIEERLRRCEEQLKQDEAKSQRVLADLDIFREKVESGDITVDEFDDPSVVRHIEELRERVKRDTAPPVPTLAVVRPRR